MSLTRTTRRSGLTLVVLGLLGVVFFWVTDPRYGPGLTGRYAWCDLAICRSGAVTVAEIAAAGVASILFPLPWFVVDEQTANARFLSDRGAGIALDQLDTKPEQLAQILLGLDRDRLAQIARAARALGKPDATRRCAELCVELAHAA